MDYIHFGDKNSLNTDIGKPNRKSDPKQSASFGEVDQSETQNRL